MCKCRLAVLLWVKDAEDWAFNIVHVKPGQYLTITNGVPSLYEELNVVSGTGTGLDYLVEMGSFLGLAHIVGGVQYQDILMPLKPLLKITYTCESGVEVQLIAIWGHTISMCNERITEYMRARYQLREAQMPDLLPVLVKE